MERMAMTKYAQAGWREAGACASADPDLFFPISTAGKAAAQIARARRVCAVHGKSRPLEVPDTEVAGTDVADMRTVETLDELTELVRRYSALFVRWSRGPAADAAGASSGELTGRRVSRRSPLSARRE
jgi:transcription factor WhiB